MYHEDPEEGQEFQASDISDMPQAEGEKRLPPALPSEIRTEGVSPDDAETQKDQFGMDSVLLPDTPLFGETLVVYLISGILLIVLGSALQYFHLFSGLFISQIAFIAGPALLYTALHKYNISRTFSFVPISLKTALLVIPIACSAFALVGIVAVLQELVFPRSREYAAVWEEVLATFQQAPLALTLFIVSLLPGVCEELLFRGFLLKGMREKFADLPAVIFVGLLFGLFHLDAHRFFTTSLLGILFGYIVVKTGSIFPAMLAHGVNNAITIFLSYGASHVQEVEHITDSSQIEELLSVEGALGLLTIVSIAVLILWAALRALPGVPRET
ncbi:MAG: CPBP family intramembrane metalloprotease [bacterium]|nr:CPBP family intramembrane metalloprotease [bacterium]